MIVVILYMFFSSLTRRLLLNEKRTVTLSLVEECAQAFPMLRQAQHNHPQRVLAVQNIHYVYYGWSYKYLS